MNFFHRTKGEFVIFPMELSKIISLTLAPYVIMFCFGYMNFGSEFFTFAHFLESRPLRMHPLVALSILLVFSVLLIFNIADLLICRPEYVSINRSSIILRGRTKLKISDIDTENIKLVGLFSNIIEISSFGSKNKIHIPLIYTNLRSDEAVSLLKDTIQKFLSMAKS